MTKPTKKIVRNGVVVTVDKRTNTWSSPEVQKNREEEIRKALAARRRRGRARVT